VAGKNQTSDRSVSDRLGSRRLATRTKRVGQAVQETAGQLACDHGSPAVAEVAVSVISDWATPLGSAKLLALVQLLARQAVREDRRVQVPSNQVSDAEDQRAR